MPPQMPMPAPPLDGVPPSPPGLGGGPQNPPLNTLAPQMDVSGGMQVVQIFLQTAAAVAKGLDLMGQIQPAFAPVAAVLLQQLRGGAKSALQQGFSGQPEPTGQMGPMVPGMMSPDSGNLPMSGPAAPQAPIPSLPSGM